MTLPKTHVLKLLLARTTALVSLLAFGSVCAAPPAHAESVCRRYLDARARFEKTQFPERLQSIPEDGNTTTQLTRELRVAREGAQLGIELLTISF